MAKKLVESDSENWQINYSQQKGKKVRMPKKMTK